MIAYGNFRYVVYSVIKIDYSKHVLHNRLLIFKVKLCSIEIFLNWISCHSNCFTQIKTIDSSMRVYYFIAHYVSHKHISKGK